MLEFPGIQGKGIDGEASLYIRIAAFLTIPIMLLISGMRGKRTGKISNKYRLIVTPPSMFFAIWAIIYTSLIVSGVYCLASNTWSLGVTVLFAVTNILNGLWVYVFSYATLTSTNVCLVILVSMTVLN